MKSEKHANVQKPFSYLSLTDQMQSGQRAGNWPNLLGLRQMPVVKGRPASKANM